MAIAAETTASRSILATRDAETPIASAMCLARTRSRVRATLRSSPVVIVPEWSHVPERSVNSCTHNRTRKAARRAEMCQRAAMGITRGSLTDEDRGPVGAWFVRAIGDRSIEQVTKDMADRGHAHKADYYRGIMSGNKKPGRALLLALEEYLGSSPEREEGGDPDVAAAIDRQTAVLSDLVQELRELRLDRDRLVALEATVDQLVGRALEQSGTAERPARGAPRARAE